MTPTLVTYSSLRDALIATLAQAPEADIEDQQMLCASCKQLAEPRLVGYGFSKEHRLAGISPLGPYHKELSAHPGGSENYSEDDDVKFLECGSCATIYRIPKSVCIRWLGIDET